MTSLLVNNVILVLSDGIKIRLTEGLREPYRSLVFGGCANYDGEFLTKNWKTEYWKPK